MRATLVLGLLAIAVLLGLSPAWLGGKMESAYSKSLDQWVPESIARVRSKAYRRGWFESHAVAELELAAGLCDNPPCPVLTLDTRIYHGPIPLGASEILGGQLRVLGGAMLSTIDFAPLFRAGRIQPGLPPLTGYTRVHLSGASSTRLDMPANGQTLSADSESFSLTSDGMLGVIDQSAGGRLVGNFEMPRLEARGQQGRNALLSGIRVEFDGTSAASAFLGQWQYAVERIRFDNPARQEQYALDNFVLNNSTTLKDGLLDALLSASVDRVALPQQTIGASHGSVHLSNLDAGALQAIGEALRAVDPTTTPPAMQLFVLLGLYQKHGLDMIQRQPALHVDELHLLTDRGVADLSLRIDVLPQQRLPVTLPEFLQALTARAMVTADEPVARHWLDQSPVPQTPDEPVVAETARIDRLDDLVEANLLQRTPDDQITTALELKDGQLWINGVRSEQFEQALELLGSSSDPAPLIDPAPTLQP